MKTNQPLIFSHIDALDNELQQIAQSVKSANAFIEVKQLQYSLSRLKTQFGVESGDDESNAFLAEQSLAENTIEFIKRQGRSIANIRRWYGLSRANFKRIFDVFNSIKEV